MNYKWIGALLILTACGGTGFTISANARKEETILQQLCFSIEYMKSDLQYHLTPLPQLCRQTAKHSAGILRKLFHTLAIILEQQKYPEASDCMRITLDSLPELPRSARTVCGELGRSLGELDLHGQLQGLNYACKICRKKQTQLEKGREQRLRSYQTLGLCAGAALAILLI